MKSGFRYFCFICASLLATQVFAADMSGWSDKTVCRLVKAGGGQEQIDEAKSRGLACGAAATSASKATVQTSTPIQPGPYPNKSSYADTMNARHYAVFPYYEMGCRVVFNAPDTGFKNLAKIQEYLKSNNCGKMNYKSDRYNLADGIEAGVKIDIDKDGIRDQLLFLYGFQPNTPLRMVAFKLNKDIAEPLDLPLDERVSPIDRIFSADEVFANGEYPEIQNARALAVADFNNDGEPDILIGDGGYDWKPRKHYPAKILMSSPEGFKAVNITEARKTHAIAAGDLNGDGHIDIILGWGQTGATRATNPRWDSSRLLINQGDGTFKKDNRSLPRSLMNKKLHQPLTLELLDVDEDGFLDILSGQGCGNYSKIFWNDGSGNFSDQSHTVIPLDYATRNNNAKNAKLGINGPKCQRVRGHVAPFYIVKEEATLSRYLGVITTENHWQGRNLTLHKINARELSKDLKPLEKMDVIYAKNPNEFAYKIGTKESKTGHEVNLYSFKFDRLSLKFDPLTEKYTKTLNNHGLNRRWKFDAAAIIENADSN